MSPPSLLRPPVSSQGPGGHQQWREAAPHLEPPGGDGRPLGHHLQRGVPTLRRDPVPALRRQGPLRTS